MSNFSLEVNPFLSLLKKEVARFFKVILQTVLTPAINSALYLLIFGLSIGNKIGSIQGTPYLLFLIPGLITMGAINNAFQNSSSSITVSKFGGDLEDLKVAPITPFQIVWAMSIAGMIRALLISFMIFGMGQLFFYVLYGEILSFYSVPYFLLYLILASLSFSHLGIFIGFFSKSFEQITLFSTFILLPLTYLGGVFFALDDLHPIWQKIAQFNPIFYFINGVKYGMLGIKDVSNFHSMIASFLFYVLSYFLAYVSVKKGSFTRFM
jgi:ABC-2 type transport system permease protein